MKANYWQGTNIRLRAFEERDFKIYIESRNNPDSIQQFYYDEILPPSSIQEVEKECKKLQEENKDDKRIFVIETLDEIYVGEVYIWFSDKKNRWFRYGIFIDDKQRGNGYAKEALVIVLDYYFNELNYNKCSPTVYEFNKTSQKFHESFGFVLEGKLRNEVYTRGKYFDMYCYGMLKDEFNANYKHFNNVLI